ncbi:hypothetical protein pb186bvf_013769 [Paramecium bursaria]
MKIDNIYQGKIYDLKYMNEFFYVKINSIGFEFYLIIEMNQ